MQLTISLVPIVVAAGYVAAGTPPMRTIIQAGYVAAWPR
jgi:hypothetical protein